MNKPDQHMRLIRVSLKNTFRPLSIEERIKAMQWVLNRLIK